MKERIRVAKRVGKYSAAGVGDGGGGKQTPGRAGFSEVDLLSRAVEVLVMGGHGRR